MMKHFSLFEGEVIHFERNLHMDKGFTERIIHWKSPKGQEVQLHFKRLVSFITKELFAIDVKIIPMSPIQQVKIISTVNGDVSNFVDKTDPRIASGHAKRLHVVEARTARSNGVLSKIVRMLPKLEVACVTSSTGDIWELSV